MPVSSSNPSDRLSLDLAVETPENIVLTYELAGPARRYLAYSIDALLRAGIAGAILLLAYIVFRWSSEQIFVGFQLVVLFFFEWCYFTLAEGLCRGKTPGKAAMGLRVIHDRGYPLTFWGAAIRNLLRGVDSIPLAAIITLRNAEAAQWLGMLPLYGPGLIAMMLSPKFQRLGDLAAGTVVISERQALPPREPIILTRVQALSRTEMNTWTPSHATLALIDEYLSRRHVLAHERGHELCAELATELAEKLDYRGDPYQLRDYPMTFIARVYVTFVRRDDDAVDEWLTRSEEAAGMVPTKMTAGGRSR